MKSRYQLSIVLSLLHLFGLDHERLTFYNNGLNRRLTDVHGTVLRKILA